MTKTIERKITKWEKALNADEYLQHNLSIFYAIQSCSSPGAKEHPRWSDLYWWVYGDCLKPYQNHSARIGVADDSPKFSDLAVAQAAFAAICGTCKGKIRSRIVVRCCVKSEALVVAQ